jgi:hypothetical protein
LGGVEWIQLAQDKDRWRAVVNAVMNLGVLAPRGQSTSHRSVRVGGGGGGGAEKVERDAKPRRTGLTHPGRTS